MIATIPASGAINVPTNEKITATFSTVMDPATITAAGTYSLSATIGGAAVAGTVTYAGSAATFAPTAVLAANTQYTAKITTAAKDLTGNAMAANFLWSFTTGAGPDVTAPTITLTNPANALVNVSLNAAVSATFSEAMDPATILAPGTFKVAVSGVGGAAVAGTVTYNSASNIATFTPAANLTASTQYTATVSNAAKDLAGNALVAAGTANPWTFTTGASVAAAGANLGTSANFGSFGGNAGITNQGINTVINGNIGTTAASTLVTGFHDVGVGCTYTETGSNIGLVNGNIDTAAPPPTVGCPSEGTSVTAAIAAQAALDALAAYNSLTPASRPGGTDPGAGQLGGLVLAPATYKAALGSFLITGTDLTLGRSRRCERGLGIPDGEFADGWRSGCASQRDSGERSAGQERLLASWKRGNDQSGRRRHDGRHDHRIRGRGILHTGKCSGNHAERPRVFAGRVGNHGQHRDQRTCSIEIRRRFERKWRAGLKECNWSFSRPERCSKLRKIRGQQ